MESGTQRDSGFFQSFRRRIGIPIELREEPPLSFFFSLSLLLSQLVEMSTLHPFAVFDQNRAHVRAKPTKISFHLRRGIDHGRGIEYRLTLQQGRECLRRGLSCWETGFNVRPIGVAARGEGLADARRAVAQANIAVAPTGVAAHPHLSVGFGERVESVRAMGPRRGHTAKLSRALVDDESTFCLRCWRRPCDLYDCFKRCEVPLAP